MSLGPNDKRVRHKGKTVTFIDGQVDGEDYILAWVPLAQLTRAPVAGDVVVIDPGFNPPPGNEGPGGVHGTRYRVARVELDYVHIINENDPVPYGTYGNTNVYLEPRT